jgi:hypothetical protein
MTQETVDLSIKKVPRDVAEVLRSRAKRNHRSLQGELLAILEDAAREKHEAITPRQLLEEVRAMGLRTPATSLDILRADRESH